MLKNNILEDSFIYTVITKENIHSLKPILHFIINNSLQPINRDCIYFVQNGYLRLIKFIKLIIILYL